MKPCPHCQHSVEDGARFCLYCATSLDEKKIWAPQRRHPRLYRTLAVACVAALTVSTVWLWPREPLPLSDAPAVSTPVEVTPVPDGITESGASGTAAPSSGATSTTLTAAPTTATTTKKGLLSFIDNLFDGDTTTAEKVTATAAKKPTSSATSAASAKATTTTSAPSTTVTTLPPRTSAHNPNHTLIETPASIAALEGESVRFNRTDIFDVYYDTSGFGDEYRDLQIDIVSVSCYLMESTQHPYIEITAWLPPSDHKLTPNSTLAFAVSRPENKYKSWTHIDSDSFFDEVMPGNYTTLIVDAWSETLGNLLDYNWKIDEWNSPIDYWEI